ncbi:MAG: hypothetical protein WC444_04520 [Candidatus Paceibacterota bacterium]
MLVVNSNFEEVKLCDTFELLSNDLCRVFVSGDTIVVRKRDGIHMLDMYVGEIFVCGVHIKMVSGPIGETYVVLWKDEWPDESLLGCVLYNDGDNLDDRYKTVLRLLFDEVKGECGECNETA